MRNLIILIVVTCAVFANSLKGAFVFDDLPIIQDPSLTTIHGVADVFHVGSFRPVLQMTYRANYFISGLNPTGWHVTNLAIHVLAVLALYLLLSEVSGSAWLSLCGALFFAVHPLWSEAVVSVSGRSSELCGLFYFAALYAVIRATHGRTISWCVLAAGLGLCALLTKEDAIVLPVIAALWLYEQRRLSYEAVVIGGSLTLFSINLPWLLKYLRAASENADLAVAGFRGGLPLVQHIPTYITALVGYYFARMVVPFQLSPDPDIAVSGWVSPYFIAALAILAGMAVLAYLTEDRLLRYGIAALLLSPLSLHVLAPATDIVLEHRAYISGLGVALLAMWAIRKLSLDDWNLARPVCVFGLAALAFITFEHNPIWSNPYSFWKEAVHQSPLKTRPHANLAATLQEMGRYDEAEQENLKVIEVLDPTCWTAYVNLASVHMAQHRNVEALRDLQTVTANSPLFASAWLNLANYHYNQFEMDQAMEAVDRALALKPAMSEALWRKAQILQAMNRPKDAQQALLGRL